MLIMLEQKGDYVKKILLVYLLGALVACKSTEKPVDPVKPVDPTPTPVVTPTPKPSDVDPDAEYCKAEGKKFNCGNPVWYGLKGCKPDSDGDNHAEGTAYFSSLEEIKAMSEKQGVTVRVKMKDGSVVQYGVGFSAPCDEI